VKAGWIEKSLGEICSIARGGSPRPIQAFLTSESDGINWVKISDATASGKYIYETAEKIKPSGAARSRIVKDGDFLLSNSMSFGRPYIMRTTGCVHDGWLVLSEYQESFNQDFLYHLLGSPQVFSQFDRLAAGSTVRNLNIELASKVIVPIPTLEEQLRIVTLLDEAFADIATAKANAEKNLQNALELIENGYIAITVRLGRTTWPISSVKTIADQRKGSMRTGPFGSQLLHSEFVDDGVAVLGIDNAVANEFRWDKRRFITEEKYRHLARYRVYPGDVLITIMGTCGRCAVVPKDIPVAINTKHLCCISLDPNKCIPDYLHAYFLHDPTAREYLAAQAKGSIMEGLNMGIISELPVRLPSVETQNAVVSQHEKLMAQSKRLIEIQQEKLIALDDLKKSLLHQAFSGQL
jgi:type I restriction enzyme S subunit